LLFNHNHHNPNPNPNLLSIIEAIGTIVGSFLGFALVSLVLYTGPDCFNCSYKPYLGGFFLFIVIFIFCSFGRKFPQYDLTVEIGLFSFIVIFGTEYIEARDTLSSVYVVDRAAMLTLGVVLAFLSSYLIFPVKGSRLIRKGLFIIIKADLGFLVSDIIKLYVSSDVSEDQFSEQKKTLYTNSSEIFFKTGKLKELLATTTGELTINRKSKFCFLALFPGKKYTPILFCINQVLYITITMFYGLQGDTSNTAYCQLFSEILNSFRLTTEKLFTDLGDFFDYQKEHSEILEHVAVLQLLVQRMEILHQENLDSGVVFSYSFDEFQAFSHLWTCLKLLMRKTSQLIDAIQKLRED